jgi:type I restriction enzyme S subunit
MNLNLLLKHFDSLIVSRSQVKDLRQAILQLAVQGKLVPQDPGDEPASALLRKIVAEKKKLIAEGKIKREKPLPLIREEEIPYELPQGWEWVRLGEICYNFGQKKPDKRFTYIDVSAIEDGRIGHNCQILNPEDAPSRARKIVNLGTVIYSTVRPYLLNIAIVDNELVPEPIVSTAFAVLHPYEAIFNRWLYYYLHSQPLIDYVQAQMVGMAYPAINDTKFFQGLLPLPSLAEQHRIVGKVDALMQLCDELEILFVESEKVHAALLQAVLQETMEK